MHSESLITRGRNKMVISFLEDETLTHLFWIDSDIAFRPELACRLLLSDKDVSRRGLSDEELQLAGGRLAAGHDARGVREAVRRVSVQSDRSWFGRQQVRRRRRLRRGRRGADRLHVHQAARFHRHDEALPGAQLCPDGPPNHPQAHLHWLFFDCMVDPDTRRYLSEDYAFCRRWRDIGGKVWVDVDTPLQHLGQMNYTAIYSRACARRGGGEAEGHSASRFRRSCVSRRASTQEAIEIGGERKSMSRSPKILS